MSVPCAATADSQAMAVSLTPQKRSAEVDAAAAKAAAAAARRKRRRALVRRTHSPKTVSQRAVMASPASSSCARVMIQPTVTGVEQVARRLQAEEIVAVPTECTYEACCIINTQQPRGQVRPSSSTTPHVYVPACLEDCDLVKNICAPKYYAIRGKVRCVVRFSETLQILLRLATKLWPGPVVLHVGVPSPCDTVHPNMLVTRHGMQYLALRCPSHPLTIKVCREYERCQDQDRNGHDATQQSKVLVGWPLKSTADASGSATGFVTMARRVPDGWPVLNGEERREIFSVPTCEHQAPWPVSLWICSRDRRIIISGTASNNTSLSVASVLQAIQSKPKPSKPSTTKQILRQRMIEAVLIKWTVTQEEES